MSTLQVVIGVVVAAVGLAGTMALAASVFRIKTRDDTIASQKGYIEALTDERDGLARRVGILEGRVDCLTADFAREVGTRVAEVVREHLSGLGDG